MEKVSLALPSQDVMFLREKDEWRSLAQFEEFDPIAVGVLQVAAFFAFHNFDGRVEFLRAVGDETLIRLVDVFDNECDVGRAE